MLLTSCQDIGESLLDDDATLLTKQGVKFRTQCPSREAHSNALDIMRLIRDPDSLEATTNASPDTTETSPHPDALHVYDSIN